ncbi:MAG: replication-associated recombination protein A [Desulfobacteraceae bacterium]|nr:replication-associated recombination protein A [Desulfobacteraceae bacterium]
MSGASLLPPLAERMRPKSLDEFVGQGHLVGRDKLLGRLVERRSLPSLLLWGPPGTGKTTLARILATLSGAHFVFFSAVLSGVKDIRRIVDEAKELREREGAQTVLFVDEIHRFNKAQQDGFLPHVESGLLILIGATTENPSFNVIAPLLSRCRVLVLSPLSEEELAQVIERALHDQESGLGQLGLTLEEAARRHLTRMADGDARVALNCLEIAASLSEPDGEGRPRITLAAVEEALQRRSLRYDKTGDEHYNLISALHKSLRDSDPDGALYWMARMLAAGEEPLYVARRLIRFASEDIGNADPQALAVALHGRDAYHTLGSPEGELALAQVAIYLATAPKSNAIYRAYNQVLHDIRETGSLEVPLHIRNSPTRLMKGLGYGQGYQYAHDHEDGLVAQEHLPPELAGRRYYQPTNRGYEAVVKDRLTKWREILRQRAGKDGKG